MSERSEVWEPTRHNIGVYGHLTRIESPQTSGIPDVAYTILGCSGWIENKLFASNEDRCPDHLTLEQVVWGEEETKAGGKWFLFGKNKLNWILYNARGARLLLKGEGSFPIFRTPTFPTKLLLEKMAPIGERLNRAIMI